MKACGKLCQRSLWLKKILRYLSQRFCIVVNSMVKSKDLATITKEELQGSLAAHEKCTNERVYEKSTTEIQLQAQSSEYKKGNRKCNGNRGRY